MITVCKVLEKFLPYVSRSLKPYNSLNIFIQSHIIIAQREEGGVKLYRFEFGFSPPPPHLYNNYNKI